MIPRSSAPNLLFAAVVLIAHAPGATAAELRQEYVDILRQYARGERTEAVVAVATWSEREVGRQLAAIQERVTVAERCPACPNALDGVPLKAAVMLHADRDEAERPASTSTEHPRPCTGRQARIAGAYAGLLAGLPETREFARRLFLAMALRSQWDFCLEEGRRWAREGLDRFPRDPDLLLAFGSIHEEGATLESGAALARMNGVQASRLDDRGLAARHRVKWFEEARRAFTEALAADPERVLARLRLGRVLWRLGEEDQARAALVEAGNGARDPRVQYLAHLFLGQVHEDAGRLDDSVAEYRRALEIEPTAQSGAVALSYGLRLRGDASGAREVMEHALSLAGRRAGRDTYWDYLVMNAMDADEIWSELRRGSLE